LPRKAAVTRIEGTIPALVTAFGDAGQVDVDTMLRHVAWLREHRIETVSALGSTGEGTSLSLSERRAVVERLAPEVGLIAGTGCTSLPETIELSKAAVDLGAAVLVAPPSYYEPSDAGVHDYYRNLFEALPGDARVVLYHIPRFTDVPLSTELLRKLRAEFGEQVAGVKDSGGDLKHTLEWVSALPELTILNGSDATAEPFYAGGGAGTITMLANVLPDTLEHIRQGRADGMQALLAEVRTMVAAFPEIAAVKHLVSVVAGVPASPVRPPLENLDELQARDLEGRFVEIRL
jgi:4-hydroxy-tetrahydrodipicolinate synthase